MSRRFHVLAALGAFVVAGHCTFNVRTERVQVTSESPVPVERLRADLSSVGSAPSGVAVVLRPGPVARATVELTALVNAGSIAEELRSGVSIGWQPASGPATVLSVSYAGPFVETVSLDAVSVTLPAGRAFELTLGASSLDAAGIGGDATVTAGSGSILLRDGVTVQLTAGSGSIDVHAQHARRLETGSGSIRAVVAQTLEVASAGSGSIHAVARSARELTTGSGSIALQLTERALPNDLALQVGSGSVDLVLACDTAVRLELQAGSGSVRVSAEGRVIDGEHAWNGALRGGGERTIRVRTGSGSIRVTERCGG